MRLSVDKLSPRNQRGGDKMVAKISTGAVNGVEGVAITVEVDMIGGMPATTQRGNDFAEALPRPA